MEERGFKGIFIPKSIWFDTRLNATEKMILMEIDSLDNGNGCFASNDYLANFCQCTTRKISDTITKLVKLKFIKVVSFDGRKRKIQSNLSLEKNSIPPRKIFYAIYNKMRNNSLDNKKNCMFREYSEEDFDKIFENLEDIEI